MATVFTLEPLLVTQIISRRIMLMEAVVAWLNVLFWCLSWVAEKCYEYPSRIAAVPAETGEPGTSGIRAKGVTDWSTLTM